MNRGKHVYESLLQRENHILRGFLDEHDWLEESSRKVHHLVTALLKHPNSEL